MGRGQSAYMLFANENRATVQEELRAAAGEGGKVGVAQVGKALGAKWNALSDDQKAVYKQQAEKLAADKAEEAAAAAAAAASPGSEGGEGGDAAEGEAAAPAGAGAKAAAAPPPFGFPTSLVKRIILVDEEVGRVSADAVRAISKAAELFVGRLAVKALEHAQAGKKKNFRAADVAHVAARDRRLVDMGLREVLEEALAAAGSDAAGLLEDEATAAAAKEEKRQAAKRQKREKEAAGTRQITAFFAAASGSDGCAAADKEAAAVAETEPGAAAEAEVAA